MYSKLHCIIFQKALLFKLTSAKILTLTDLGTLYDSYRRDLVRQVFGLISAAYNLP